MAEKPVLPGWHGMPFRGPVPHLKEDDPEHRQPQEGSQLHVDVLDLSKPAQLARYAEIGQMVVNGFAIISYEDREYDKVVKNWRVLIRWFELFAYVPDAVAGGAMYGRPR